MVAGFHQTMEMFDFTGILLMLRYFHRAGQNKK
jgi:hypothetical protein